MTKLINEPVFLGILVGAIISLFVFQIIVILRIKKTLHQISFYLENILRFFYHVGFKPNATSLKTENPKTCQFCKHRLSFIHMSENKGEVEDFYYKCKLRNIEIQLNETCEKYSKDEHYTG